MHGDVFTQLSLVIVIAAAVSLLMRMLKQPLIMGYILTGIIVGPSVLHVIEDKEAFETFSELGIALLLFIIGLELSVSVVKKLGKPVVLTALSLLLTIGTLGWLVATLFHFTPAEAFITGLALFFSSTIIIAKVLSDKKELSRLNGQIAIGVILVDDIIATFALLIVAAQSGGSLTAGDIGLLIVKGILFVFALFIVGAKVLPRFTKYIAKSQELLFVFALAWGFGVASLVNAIGFSIEVGALFAGVALAHLPYSHQIGARLKPLRDFFIILFFITLGERLLFDNVAAGIVPALILSAMVLIVKPLAVMVALGALGYTRRTSFKTGINLSQISEFSIILVVLAGSAGVVSDELMAIITIVAIITIAVSTYLMKYDNWIYAKFEEQLHIFERRKVTEPAYQDTNFSFVLFGYKNGGEYILESFEKLGEPYIVADYNPEVIQHLDDIKAPYIYGDVTDPEVLGEINIDTAKLVINTIGDHAVNMSFVRYVRRHNKETIIVCYARTTEDAQELYRLGATRVILPYWQSSEQLGEFIAKYGASKQLYQQQPTTKRRKKTAKKTTKQKTTPK